MQGTLTHSTHVANARLLGISLSRERVAALDSNKISFKGLASPFGVATRCANHCLPRVAQPILAIQTYRGLHLPHGYPCSLSSVPNLKKNWLQLEMQVLLVLGLNRTPHGTS